MVVAVEMMVKMLSRGRGGGDGEGGPGCSGDGEDCSPGVVVVDPGGSGGGDGDGEGGPECSGDGEGDDCSCRGVGWQVVFCGK